VTRRFALFHRDRWTVDGVVQAAIAILSPIAILLLAEKEPLGFVVGLVSQPFWIYATAKARQSGMFLISIAYMVIWIRGIWNSFPQLIG
jgi:hypothetical protein